MESKILHGQKALVTGASSGIGKAIAIALAREGADVLVNYFSHDEEAAKVCDEIEDAGSKAFPFQANVSKEEDVVKMFSEALDRFGRLDILVSNAGVQKDAPTLEMTLDQWQKVIDINLTGGFLCAREAAKIFVKQGVDEQISKSAGKIIFMSSVHEIIPWAGHVNYAAAKGGLRMLMKTLTQELADRKIRVNSIGPGAIKTAINQDVWSDETQRKSLLELIPYRRLGDADEIGKAVAWLASDQADYVNGTTFFIDGGMSVYPAFADNG